MSKRDLHNDMLGAHDEREVTLPYVVSLDARDSGLALQRTEHLCDENKIGLGKAYCP
jgi:hypothetical protein